jgi:hypothetical protein
MSTSDIDQRQIRSAAPAKVDRQTPIDQKIRGFREIGA